MNRRNFLWNSLAMGTLLSGAIPFSCKRFAANLPANITDFSATDLSMAIQNKQVSCVEVM